jgi:hypothetical protein
MFSCNEKKENLKFPPKKTNKQTIVEKCHVTNICKGESLNGTKRLKTITLLSLVTKNEQNVPCATIHSISPFIILETNKQTNILELHILTLHAFLVWQSSNHHCNVHIHACFYYICVATMQFMGKM